MFGQQSDVVPILGKIILEITSNCGTGSSEYHNEEEEKNEKKKKKKTPLYVEAQKLRRIRSNYVKIFLT